jgi:hypothetical protein
MIHSDRLLLAGPVGEAVITSSLCIRNIKMLRKYARKGNNSWQKPESGTAVTVIWVWTKGLH